MCGVMSFGSPPFFALRSNTVGKPFIIPSPQDGGNTSALAFPCPIFCSRSTT